MSTEKEDTAPANVTLREAEAEPMPTPPMLWLLVPVALLALLAFLSRG